MIWRLKEKAKDILSNETGTLFKEGASELLSYTQIHMRLEHQT